MLKRDYGFDEAFNIFDGIDSKFNNLNEYKPRTSNKNNTKKTQYQTILKIWEKGQLIYLLLLVLLAI